jgi:radical SAM protein with 4Fe4S-binding SPASM domain
MKSTAKLFVSYVYLSKKDISDFTKKFSFVDSIITMPAEKFNKKYKDIPHSESRYKEKEWPCIRLWNNFFISVDGKVYLCCKDFNGEIVMGDLKKQSFHQIYGKFEKLRQFHLNKEYKKVPLCDECGALVQNSTLWW